LNAKYPWVDAVCERFREVAGEMARIPPVIVHGECYPKNVVVVDDVLYFVDWQSAALGCGEIDLASLTENWGEAVQVECRRIYASQRWPHGAPGRMDSYFTIAQLYWHLRWLGGAHVRTNTPGLGWRYSEMRSAAEKLHFI
jgi:thiamine kinase-like enzyme